jgi:hypothetical protein
LVNILDYAPQGSLSDHWMAIEQVNPEKLTLSDLQPEKLIHDLPGNILVELAFPLKN